jgi:hypothetical protein
MSYVLNEKSCIRVLKIQGNMSLFQVTGPTFALGDLINPHFRLAVSPAGMWTRYFPDTDMECYNFISCSLQVIGFEYVCNIN